VGLLKYKQVHATVRYMDVDWASTNASLIRNTRFLGRIGGTCLKFIYDFFSPSSPISEWSISWNTQPSLPFETVQDQAHILIGPTDICNRYTVVI